MSIKYELTGGRYTTVSGSTIKVQYYAKDYYLSNNRAVINGTTGLLEQAVAYYPYGGVIADLGPNATTGQPYKFGGKELITANGLNEYDFGARQYYSAVPGFTKPDPMCEKYYWLSPYLYCGNNPVNAIDPTGMDIWNVDETGHLISSETFEYYDMILFYDSNMTLKDNWIGDNGSIIVIHLASSIRPDLIGILRIQEMCSLKDGLTESIRIHKQYIKFIIL